MTHHRSLATALATAALTLTTALGAPPVTATAHPASAESGCSAGNFCLYTEQNRTGGVLLRASYDNDLKDTKVAYNAASWWNHSNASWRIWSDVHCSGNSVTVPPDNWGNVIPEWFGHIKSINAEGSLTRCRTSR
ncbi:peptidase inhibitor family I36 protein [Kitasatospora sp. NPDC059408]|uniref:peptidase inhibitor family I36 protein n=1 Tax=Kitasatospora sp. NPDC059408 TaxID=3346823 RepID=UPI00368F06E9